MADDESLEKLVNQLGDILGTFWKKKDGQLADEEISKKTLEDIEILTQSVGAMSQAMDVALIEEGYSEVEIQRIIHNPPDTMDPKDRALLEKVKRMKKEVAAFTFHLKLAAKKSLPGKKKPTSIFKKDEQPVKDSGKPLNVGFKKGWKKL